MRVLIVAIGLWLGGFALAQDLESITIIRFENLAQSQARDASARVESLDQARIAAEVAARVIEIPVRVGEVVESGQLLLRLDRADYELALQAAQAGLDLTVAGQDLARLRAERARRLAPNQFVSEDQLLEAETRLRQAQAEQAAAEVELNRAQLMLSRTEVTSPYDAVVQARLIGTGSLAAPGTALFELVATERLELSSGIASALVDGLLQSRQVEFKDGDRRYPVRLLRISPLVSAGARQREARFEFIDAAPAPGSQGTVEWVDPRPVLPADYVVLRGDELGVLMVASDQVAGSRAEVRWHALPFADAGRPVLVDFSFDALLVDDGRRRVQPGQLVNIEAEAL